MEPLAIFFTFLLLFLKKNNILLKKEEEYDEIYRWNSFLSYRTKLLGMKKAQSYRKIGLFFICFCRKNSLKILHRLQFI